MDNSILRKIYGTLAVAGMFMVGTVQAQTSYVDKLFPNVVISKVNYDKAVNEIKNNPGGKFAKAYNNVKNVADKCISSNKKADPVKNWQTNPATTPLNEQMSDIYNLCVSYAFTGNQTYLNKAVENLSAWARVNKALPKSSIQEERYMPAMEGYSLIRRSVPEESRKLIDKWAADRMNVFLSNPDLRVNNWGTSLLVQYAVYGYVLERKDWVELAQKEYPEWVKKNLYPNGATTDLLGRDAFAYHAYDLLFFARMCRLKAIFQGYEAADKFYTQDVNWGASIKHSVDFWKPYLLDAKKNFHLEFLQTEWEPDKKRGDYNKPYNPAGTIYVIDEFFEFDESLKDILSQYRGGSYTWKAALSSLRYIK